MNISKRTRLIIGIVVAVIMLGTGGYLLWRTNQQDTVAPTDSDASSCPSGCYWHTKGEQCVDNGGGCVYETVGWDYEKGETIQEVVSCDPCTADPGTGGGSEDGTVLCNQSCETGSDCKTGYCHYDNQLGKVCRNKACATKSSCQCDTGTTTDTLLACGKSGCTKDADCEGYAEGTHECDEVTSGDTSQQYCVRLESSCPDGQVLADDKCTCEDEIVKTQTNVCGDGACTEPENSENCPEDCTAECGDGICNEDENANTCPGDCDAVCGDGYCTHDETETTCAQDCATSQPQAGLFDDISNSMKLGLGFISLGFITTQVNKVANAYDVAVGSREIKIRRKRRDKFEKGI